MEGWLSQRVIDRVMLDTVSNEPGKQFLTLVCSILGGFWRFVGVEVKSCTWGVSFFPSIMMKPRDGMGIGDGYA